MLSLQSQALATSNEKARAAIYNKLDNMVVDQLPVMPIQTEPIYSVVKKGLSGWSLNPLGWPTLATVSAG
jgi:peptide/nickel transport system substrate-binding protein